MLNYFAVKSTPCIWYRIGMFRYVSLSRTCSCLNRCFLYREALRQPPYCGALCNVKIIEELNGLLGIILICTLTQGSYFKPSIIPSSSNGVQNFLKQPASDGSPPRRDPWLRRHWFEHYDGITIVCMQNTCEVIAIGNHHDMMIFSVSKKIH